MQYRVTFLPDSIERSVPQGTLISDAAKQAGVWINAPCGGNGTCGKCTVRLNIGGKEQTVLACQSVIDSECTITIGNPSSLVTLRDGAQRDVPFVPEIESCASCEEMCFAAIDLGTTSIVCYLLDGFTGDQLSVKGIQNPQAAYGADVITRANHVLTAEDSNALRRVVIEAINNLIDQTTRVAGRKPDQVTAVSIVGNTVMHHILLGLPLGSLVRAPYTPNTTGDQTFPARELELKVNPAAIVRIPAVIGGFVGADTVACMSATAFDKILRPTLMIDIGTNGELVCTDGVRSVCCSTAAGPAFEGANISSGMRAENGAVDHVWMENGIYHTSTIAHTPALGICGSGLIDLIATLVNTGTIDETGRFSYDGTLSDRLVQDCDGKTAFLVSRGEQDILLSQKDVRELQLGKAAIRAGISVLLDELSLSTSDINSILIAGAFGSHLSADSLCDIGLLPEEFRGKIESIGNAAGEGAKLYVKNNAVFRESAYIARETEYIELTLSSVFSDYYIDAMAFPETDAE